MNQIILLRPQVNYAVYGVPRVPAGAQPAGSRSGVLLVGPLVFLVSNPLSFVLGNGQNSYLMASADQVASPVEGSEESGPPGNIMVQK